MSAKRRKGRAGKVVVAAAVAIAAAGVAAAAVGFDLTSIGRPAEAEPAEVPTATAEVVRQTLTETISFNGDVGYGAPLGLECPFPGTITGLPAAGDVINRGDTVYTVDDRPAILLYGSLPAYRPLAAGTEGRDVKQFEKNLAGLGYDGFTVDDTYTDSTAAAVRAWQADLGLEKTGVVDLGRVVYHPDRIRVELVEVELGDAAQPGGPVLTYTGLDQVVTVDVELDAKDLVDVGTPVTIRLPDGTETTGTVSDFKTVVRDNEDPEGETVLEVDVAADDPADLDGLDQAAAGIGFAGESAEDVLTVPVEALLGLAEGGYALEVVDGASRRLVAVEIGLFADGQVEVSGDGLAEGMTVVVPA